MASGLLPEKTVHAVAERPAWTWLSGKTPPVEAEGRIRAGRARMGFARRGAMVREKRRGEKNGRKISGRKTGNGLLQRKFHVYKSTAGERAGNRE